MAGIRQLSSGKWNVQVRRKGYPLQTKSFITRTDADRWARTVESEMDRGVFVCRSEAEATTLGQALERYRQEVTPHKKGAKRESDRIGVWLQTDLSKRSMASLKGSDFASYRDKRLAEVSSNTVRLELAIVSHLFTIAQQEWNLPVLNPIQSIRKPKGSHARSRRFEGDEEQRLMSAAPWQQFSVSRYMSAHGIKPAKIWRGFAHSQKNNNKEPSNAQTKAQVSAIEETHPAIRSYFYPPAAPCWELLESFVHTLFTLSYTFS